MIHQDLKWHNATIKQETKSTDVCPCISLGMVWGPQQNLKRRYMPAEVWRLTVLWPVSHTIAFTPKALAVANTRTSKYSLA
eukprot:418581-Pelagomonas_calceolata.AAC.1